MRKRQILQKLAATYTAARPFLYVDASPPLREDAAKVAAYIWSLGYARLCEVDVPLYYPRLLGWPNVQVGLQRLTELFRIALASGIPVATRWAGLSDVIEKDRLAARYWRRLRTIHVGELALAPMLAGAMQSGETSTLAAETCLALAERIAYQEDQLESLVLRPPVYSMLLSLGRPDVSSVPLQHWPDAPHDLPTLPWYLTSELTRRWRYGR